MEKKSLLKRITSSHETSLIIVLILLCIFVELKSPGFLSSKNILEILKNNSVIMIMVLGMLCVLLVGGIDISITSSLAFSGMTMGMLIKYDIIHNTLLAFVIACVIGTICGFAYLVANSQWAGADALGDFNNFALESNLGFGIINNVLVIVIICYVVFFIMLKWTKFGRNIYAVGSNAEAAEISGINVARVKLAVYTIMGFLCGLCGAMATSIYASAQPNMQLGKELDVIAACVIGGVSMNGGRGSVGGALLGALILAIISKALPLIGIDAIAQNTVKGLIIFIVIVLNVVTKRMLNKRNLERREM